MSKNPLETKYIWLNGKLVPFAKATVHFLNHSLHYGSAVFEGERCYDTPNGPAVFRLGEHTERLIHSAKTVGMKVPYSKEEIMKATLALLKANKLKEAYIRPLFFYTGKMGLSPIGASLSLGIAAWPWGSYLAETVRVKTVDIRRIDPRTIVPTAKVSGHYVNSILASLEATKAKVDEALLLDTKGLVAEGPGENLFMVKKGVLYTPELGGILPGITRNSIMTLAQDLGIKVIEKAIKPAELKTADELFFTGTAAEVSAISELDGKKINGGKIGPITAKLKEQYDRVIHGAEPKYYQWLTWVK